MMCSNHWSARSIRRRHHEHWLRQIGELLRPRWRRRKLQQFLSAPVQVSEIEAVNACLQQRHSFIQTSLTPEHDLRATASHVSSSEKH